MAQMEAKTSFGHFLLLGALMLSAALNSTAQHVQVPSSGSTYDTPTLEQDSRYLSAIKRYHSGLDEWEKTRTVSKWRPTMRASFPKRTRMRKIFKSLIDEQAYAISNVSMLAKKNLNRPKKGGVSTRGMITEAVDTVKDVYNTVSGIFSQIFPGKTTTATPAPTPAAQPPPLTMQPPPQLMYQARGPSMFSMMPAQMPQVDQMIQMQYGMQQTLYEMRYMLDEIREINKRRT